MKNCQLFCDVIGNEFITLAYLGLGPQTGSCSLYPRRGALLVSNIYNYDHCFPFEHDLQYPFTYTQSNLRIIALSSTSRPVSYHDHQRELPIYVDFPSAPLHQLIHTYSLQNFPVGNPWANLPLTDVKDGSFSEEKHAHDFAASTKTVDAQKYGTDHDHRDMARMDKIQRLRVGSQSLIAAVYSGTI